MERIKENLRNYKFQLHLTALLLMLIPPIAMYFASQGGASSLVWILIGIVILGNLLAVLIP